MTIEVVVPRLGWSMDEGTFVEWLKRDGEFVGRGEMLFVIEGDKAAQEVESFDQGFLRIPASAPKPGERVRVGQTLAFLLAEADSAKIDTDTSQSAMEIRSEPRGVEPADDLSTFSHLHSFTPSEIHKRPRSTPRARRKAAELGVDWTSLVGGGRSGRIRERDVVAAALNRIDESPRIADEHTPIDPQEASTGASKSPTDSVQSSNSVETFKRRREDAFSDSSSAATARRIGIRRAVAARMIEAHRSAAPVTVTTTIDAENLFNLREQFRASSIDDRPIPSYTDIIIKLSAFALDRSPNLNASLIDDRIVIHESVHIGVAVDTDAGLLVPVVRNVSKRSLLDVAATTRDLIDRARAGKIKAEELRGGTFTVTNLGSFGIDAFTPIINLPECAILGIGRIERRPVVIGEAIVARRRTTFSLTFDHRIVDGAPAARFLESLGRIIENPSPWLIA